MCVGKKKVPDERSPPTKTILSPEKISEHPVAPTTSQTSLKRTSSKKLKVKGNSSMTSPSKRQVQTTRSSVSHTSTSKLFNASTLKQPVEKAGSLVTAKKSSTGVHEESKDSGVLRPNNKENSIPTQEENPTPLQHVQVDPPKKMYARRKIDEKREAKDAAYKTLADLEKDRSEWEEAEIVRRVELKKDEPRVAASRPTESRKSTRKKKESEEKDDE